MAITSQFVLASDVLMIPAKELASDFRKRAECTEDDIALSRPHSRTPSVVVDEITAALLEEFRQPNTIVQAVISYSKARHLDPNATLEDAFPVLDQLIRNHLLVDPAAQASVNAFPTLRAGNFLGDAEILSSAQVLEDVEVYRVRLPGGMPAVIKIPTQTDEYAQEMVQREARVLDRLGGIASPKLLQVGTFQQRPYLVMEWCHGVPCLVVADEARAKKGSSPGLLDLCRSIVRAYAHIHKNSVLHGDVHPRNVLVDRGGSVKIIDFGLARELDRGDEMPGQPRGGVGFFFDPEIAQARLLGRMPSLQTARGEQYSIGALLYLLIIGVHYIDFSVEESKVMREIVSEPMVPFARHGLTWPSIEAVIETALQKQTDDRHSSLAVMSLRLDDVCLPEEPVHSLGHRAAEADGTVASELLATVLRRVNADGDLIRTGLSLPPTCSVNYGAGGIAYALYRIACLLDDSDMLVLADRWLQHAMQRKDIDDAFYNPKFRVTPETVGRISIYHGSPGLYTVDALLSRAMGDTPQHSRAIRAFISTSQEPCAEIDLTLGRSGVLVAAALLLETLDARDQENRSALVALGDSVNREIKDRLESFGPVCSSPELDYLGIAHGWAGVLFAALRWAQVTNRPLTDQTKNRLSELAACAEPIGRGIRWRARTLAVDPEGLQGYMPGWCNGSAGFVHLWTLAYEMTRDSHYLVVAERAGWNAWEQPDGVRSLCCGLAGRAYSLLNLSKHTNDREWTERARHLMHRASRESREENPFRNSLYKGEVGIALLIAEMAEPDIAAMPMFETEGWSHFERSRCSTE